MNLSSLPKLKARSAKRLGRGIGSGKGKTSGRGTKGQKARGKVPVANVGAGLILYKKLPFKRGWGNRKAHAKPVIIKFEQLNKLKANSIVNIATLAEAGLINIRETAKVGVKILAEGELKIPLNIELSVSKQAQSIIEKAGGKVVSK